MLDLTKFESDAPTPGQSLTSEPGGSRPWENPPRYNDDPVRRLLGLLLCRVSYFKP